MVYRRLGKSGLEISEIGFGCMSLQENNAVSKNIIDRAIAAGINLFDTADVYQNGQNETILGRAIKHKRKEVIIATKVGNQMSKDGRGLVWNPRKDHIISSVEGSLERLQTDYIDLYQLHGGTIEDPINETIEAFEMLVDQGKIRFYGISSIRPNVIREYVDRSKIVSVMMQYSVLDRRPEEACFELLEKNKIGVLARGTIANGLLLNKHAEKYLSYDLEDVVKAATAVSLLANANRNSTQTALRFVLKEKTVTSAIVGIRTMEQLVDAIQTVNSPLLTFSEINNLNNILLPGCYDQHR